MKELALRWRHYHIMEALSLEEDPRYNEGDPRFILEETLSIGGAPLIIEDATILSGALNLFRGGANKRGRHQF